MSLHVEQLGTGTEAQQLARLRHVLDVHGYELRECPECLGAVGGCTFCDDEDGMVFKEGDATPCSSSCPMHEVRQ